MSKARIYMVTNEQGKKRLIRATSKAMAIGFCARNAYAAQLASQDQIVAFMTEVKDAKVEDAVAQANAEEKEKVE